jgi:phosphoglycolate phosphatase
MMPAPKRIKLVIFDLDGTLVSSFDDVWRQIKEQSKKVPELRILRSRKDLLKLYKGNFYEELCGMLKQERGCASKLSKSMSSTFVMQTYKPRLVRGMMALLRKLSGTHKLAVLSSNFTHVIESVLRKHKAAKYFSFLSGADKEASKTKRLRRLFRKFRMSADKAVYVTDTSGDIKEAGKAGLRSLGVSWGFHESRLLRKAGAIAIVRKPSDIARWLDG